MTVKEALYTYVVRIADDSLILGQRLAEWCGHGPILEEDIALTNISLDLIGQATNLFQYAVTLEDKGRTEDQLAFLRVDREYSNLLLVEQPNKDFGYTIARQFYFDAFRKLFFESLTNSEDTQLAAIAEKSLKETKYHLKHSSEWIIRLGDGTEESHQRIQDAVNFHWRFTHELFFQNEVDKTLIELGIGLDLATLFDDWKNYVSNVLQQATLELPSHSFKLEGGRTGMHSEHLGYLLAEMQYMQRAFPNLTW
jgi:ring-1,2-phenylacetyl-CoA epoxidase subunit PaaC